ncbi:type II toxin-antitoxin system prevent-host-death family antitoxin [Brevundimonas sp.]|uniref:type II toxin-antitoxin system Phd/YefM family antitoxin n=1 Tax=Brevundimonas sp. TaxID=1871086 RepID=UPI002ABB31E3|nr:type II toxin-antitoxin system prevent-host-death family antitoxin [Brevundimonas sp.]MDZ4365139.1 type II toxin-antitoxin system prevent-host-death family antitoxin [Brevundimonas sp.]
MTHDQITGEAVITATEFKAKCLELLDRVQSGEIRRLKVTKRGKSVAEVVPDSSGRSSFFGWQKGSFDLPDDLDIDGPVYDPERDGVCDLMSGLRLSDR